MDRHEAYLEIGSRAQMSKFTYDPETCILPLQFDMTSAKKLLPRHQLNILFTLDYLAMISGLWTLLQCWRYFPGYLDSISLRPPELS